MNKISVVFLWFCVRILFAEEKEPVIFLMDVNSFARKAYAEMGYMEGAPVDLEARKKMRDELQKKTENLKTSIEQKIQDFKLRWRGIAISVPEAQEAIWMKLSDTPRYERFKAGETVLEHFEPYLERIRVLWVKGTFFNQKVMDRENIRLRSEIANRPIMEGPIFSSLEPRLKVAREKCARTAREKGCQAVIWNDFPPENWILTGKNQLDVMEATEAQLEQWTLDLSE